MVRPSAVWRRIPDADSIRAAGWVWKFLYNKAFLEVWESILSSGWLYLISDDYDGLSGLPHRISSRGGGLLIDSGLETALRRVVIEMACCLRIATATCSRDVILLSSGYFFLIALSTGTNLPDDSGFTPRV